MTDEQIRLVRESFSQLQPLAEPAAAQFYDRLFERSPGVAELFRVDMAVQGHRLMTMLGAAIGLLDDPARLDEALRGLGARHVGYGTLPSHYDVLGGALIDTLALSLGPQFSPAHRRAWAAFYGHLRTVMLSGAAH